MFSKARHTLAIALTALLTTLAIIFGGGATATATPVPDSDFSEFDRDIMITWLGALLGQGFQRYLNGDGGGQGAVSDACPVCGQGNFPNDDGGAAALAEHLFWQHFQEWLRTQPRTGTGSA